MFKLMIEGNRESPPDVKKEQEKKLNWHLTELPSGAFSVGTTTDEVGYYPADGEKGTTDSWVAPWAFVENYFEESGQKFYDNNVREAIMAWRDRERNLDLQVMKGFGGYASIEGAYDSIPVALRNEERLRLMQEYRYDSEKDEITITRLYVKRSDGSFGEIRGKIENGLGDQVEVNFLNFDDGGNVVLHKNVYMTDLIGYQDEARLWVKRNRKDSD